MPIFDISAIDWSVDEGMGASVQAGSFTATYRQVIQGTGMKWDPAYFNGIKPYRGEDTPDLIRIKADVDGAVEELILGVVDESGWSDRGGDRVGAVAGRDKLALVLDKRILNPITIQGATITSAGALTYNKSLKDALTELVPLAGLSVDLDSSVLDYKLGASVPVPVDRTFGEIIDELLRPLRWSEKHRVDAWIEGTTLRLAKRNYVTPKRGTITVDYARLAEVDMRKGSVPLVADVRIDGFTYEIQIADPNLATGQPYSTSYGPNTITEYIVTQEKVGGVLTTVTKIVSWIEEGTFWYDDKGRLTNSHEQKTYLVGLKDASGNTTRVETKIKTNDYIQDPVNKALDGLRKSEHEEFRVQQVWNQGASKVQSDEIVSERKSEWSYYSDNGDTQTESIFEVQKEERGFSLPLAIKVQRVTRSRFKRSAGQLFRDYEITEYNTKGEPQNKMGVEHVGAIRHTVTGGTVAPAGKVRSIQQVSAGPESVGGGGRIRREVSALLGLSTDCGSIRTDLTDEHASRPLRLSCQMAPNIHIKPGMLMTVQNAPAFWPVTSFYVTSVRRSSASKMMDQRVEALAWVGI